MNSELIDFVGTFTYITTCVVILWMLTTFVYAAIFRETEEFENTIMHFILTIALTLTVSAAAGKIKLAMSFILEHDLVSFIDLKWWLMLYAVFVVMGILLYHLITKILSRALLDNHVEVKQCESKKIVIRIFLWGLLTFGVMILLKITDISTESNLTEISPFISDATLVLVLYGLWVLMTSLFEDTIIVKGYKRSLLC